MILPPSCQRTDDINVAIARLGMFILRMAAKITRVTGVNYEESLSAPSTFEEVKTEWQLAKKTTRPFKVYSGASDRTIYDSPHVNWAFRFWHDYLHVFGNRGMNFYDEAVIAKTHIEAVAAEFGESSLEAKIIEADTYGQAVWYAVNGSYVEDQREFVTMYVKHGAMYALATYRNRSDFGIKGSLVSRIGAPVIGALEMSA